ncbi:MAG: hypothetical protein Q7S80_01055 [bacterium]|nr:hypothetical protein [bacterium]
MPRKWNWTDYGAGLAVWTFLGSFVSSIVALTSAALHGRFNADPTVADGVNGIVFYAVTSIIVAWINIRRLARSSIRNA